MTCHKFVTGDQNLSQHVTMMSVSVTPGAMGAFGGIGPPISIETMFLASVYCYLLPCSIVLQPDGQISPEMDQSDLRPL